MKTLLKTLIANARIFGGKSDKLSEPMSVLVVGDKLTKIAKPVSARLMRRASCSCPSSSSWTAIRWKTSTSWPIQTKTSS